jgi:hypothetical protein
VLTEDYRNARDFSDVKIALSSDSIDVHPSSGVAEGPFRAVVEAFLADTRGRAIRFLVDAIQLSPVTFSGHGRTSARFAEIPSARIEVG